ncbi:cupin domain-containing protein [Leucobacter luti]|uniref:(S)-ureidoglycine aminohydrolase cupin domain-containing protein n=1 Tax=Leucobacter luti TaxID=340320 RepID=A0A4R6S7D3_9MICO|nr:cupin domain-containing protein [Leucobacter luti]QYM75336.1 cupin domain-containing protein [Leucobacter luti]TDP95621.1 hypothetical protein EDF62_0312 [Leucobacter luti]
MSARAAETELPEGLNAVVRAASVPVALDAVATDDVVAGSPEQGFVELGSIAGVGAGIWELRGGTVTDTEIDELFVVLSGWATIELLSEPDTAPSLDRTGDPRTVEVGPGDVMRLVAGTRTKWTVPDHIRKIYIAAE